MLSSSSSDVPDEINLKDNEIIEPLNSRASNPPLRNGGVNVVNHESPNEEVVRNTATPRCLGSVVEGEGTASPVTIAEHRVNTTR